MPAPLALSFQPLTRGDFALLATWLARPHVAQWWQHETDPAALEADFGAVVDGTDPGEVFLAYDGATAIGLVQRYRFGDNPEWLEAFAMLAVPAAAMGIDYFLADATRIGQGLGTALLRAFVADTWARHPETPMLVVDVDQANVASWRVLEKLGFERVWAGKLASAHPSDAGEALVLRLVRPGRAGR